MPPVLKPKEELKIFLNAWDVSAKITKSPTERPVFFDEVSDRFVVNPAKLSAVIQSDDGKNLDKTIRFFTSLGAIYKNDVQAGQTYQDENWSTENPGLLNLVSELVSWLRPITTPEPQILKEARSVLTQHIGSLDQLISQHPDLANKTIGVLLENINEGISELEKFNSLTTLGRLSKTIEASGLAADVVKKFLLQLKVAGLIQQGNMLLFLSGLAGVIEKSGMANEVVDLLIGTVQYGGKIPGHPENTAWRELGEETFYPTRAKVLDTLVGLKSLVIKTGNKDKLLALLQGIYDGKSYHVEGVGDICVADSLAQRQIVLEGIMAFETNRQKIDKIVVDLLKDLNGSNPQKRIEAATLLKSVDLTKITSLSPLYKNDSHVIKGLLDRLRDSNKGVHIAALNAFRHFKDFIRQCPEKNDILSLFSSNTGLSHFPASSIYLNVPDVYRVYCQILIALKDVLSNSDYKNSVMQLVWAGLKNGNKDKMEILESTLDLLTEYKELFDQDPFKAKIMDQLVSLMKSVDSDVRNAAIACLASLGEGLTLRKAKKTHPLDLENLVTWPNLRRKLKKILFTNLDLYTDSTKPDVMKALGVLGRQIANGKKKVLDQITEILVDKLGDADAYIRSAAIEALNKLHPDFNLWLTKEKLQAMAICDKVRSLIVECCDKLITSTMDGQTRALDILINLKELLKKSDLKKLKELVGVRLEHFFAHDEQSLRYPAVYLSSQLDTSQGAESDVDTMADFFGEVAKAESTGEASELQRNTLRSVLDTLSLEADAIIELGQEGRVLQALGDKIKTGYFAAAAARTLVTYLYKIAAKAHPPLPIEPNIEVANWAMGAALMVNGKLTVTELQAVLRKTPDGEIAPQLREGLETLVAGSGDQIVPDGESIDSTVEVEDEVALAERNDPAWLTAAAFMQMVPIAPVGVGVPLISN